MNHLATQSLYDPDTGNQCYVEIFFDGKRVLTKSTIHITPHIDRYDPKLPESEQCGASVYWWNGEYDGNCILAKGHDTDHYDGISWYNDQNEQVDAPNLSAQPTEEES